MNELYEFDKIYQSAHPLLCGIDEAGRGPLAGPVFAAAVMLPPDFRAEGLNDSKKLTPKKRAELYRRIKDGATAFGVDFASVQEINELNILNAGMIAMRRAFNCLKPRPGLALIDGAQVRYFDDIETVSIIDGDAKSACIAAASILAKVCRDRYMEMLAIQFPEYLFEKHKGYGTAEHIARIHEFGASPAHRELFLRKIMKDSTETESVGKAGEDLICAKLVSEGYNILRRNYRTRFGEIDIIAERGEILAFVEVKTRKDRSFADGLEAIDENKRRKIKKTAGIWLSIFDSGLQPRFDAAIVYGVHSRNPEVSYIENAFG